MRFADKLTQATQSNTSWLCIGLDPHLPLLPAALQGADNALYTFCATIIEATEDIVCAFKPNIAFFEAHGEPGIHALYQLMARPRRVPFILDAKRGDMSSSAAAYAQAVFGQLNADAVTLSPYQGSDALEPFLSHKDRGCFILCKTSNPGSSELQDLELANGRPLYLEVARLAKERWNRNANVGLVVGATQPQALREVRERCPDLPFLVPGVGAQGGDLSQAVQAAADINGGGVIVNASRSVLYASSTGDYAAAARAEALRLREEINSAISVGMRDEG